MAIKEPTTRQREVMRAHRHGPTRLTQAEVMRKLNLHHSNDFYRLFYRATIADAKEPQAV